MELGWNLNFGGFWKTCDYYILYVAKYAAFILDTLVSQAAMDQKQLFVAFIDLKKAYVFVFRDGLFF